MAIKKVGVVGCGLMGSGITEVCARAGYATRVREVNQQLLDRGLANLQASLGRAVERGRATAEERDQALARIQGTLNLEDFADCDLVIEAVIENLEEKRRVFTVLDKVCPSSSILASNTSTMCIMEMASVTQRPDKVIGIHFFNPAPIMKLVEVIRTIASSDEAVAQGRAFAESLGKTVVMAKDTPGFIVNRLLVPYLNDAIRLLEAETATKEDIDKAMELGLNHPMGPFRLLDLVGLDTHYYICLSQFDEFREPRFAPPPLLKRMVVAGRLGRKAGKGFYDYK